MTGKKIVSISIIASFILIVFPLFFYILKFHSADISNNTQDWGAFITYLGGILGIGLSTLSVYLLYQTLKITSDNAKDSAQFAKQTVENSRLLQVESAFFNMLDVQNAILKSFSYGNIRQLAGHLEQDLNKQGNTETLKTINQVQFFINSFYLRYFEEHAYFLGHYFRHLYNIIKYIDDSSLNHTDKQKYINLVQAQMNDDELFITFINVVSQKGNSKFYPLILSYPDFFENTISRGPIFDKIKTVLFPTTNFKHQSLDKFNFTPIAE